MELTDFVDMFQTVAYEGYGKHKIIIKDKNSKIFNDKNIKIYKNDKDKIVEIIFQEHDNKKVNDMNELEKENAELKEIIDNDVDKKIYVQLANKAELADVQKDQLTKAKEIIGGLLGCLYSVEYDRVSDLEQAEQFLKEIEK